MTKRKHLLFCLIAASLICFPLITQVKAATIIFSEGFEGTFPGSNWTVGDAKPANGLDYWDDVSVKYRSGLWSGYCAGIGTHDVNTTVWSENFEGAFPTADYTVWDYADASGLDTWDDTNYRAHTGSWSAWCAQNGTQLVGVDYIANFDLHRYDNNMEARMLRWADLSSYDYATLSYWYWKDCDVGDYFWSAYHTSNQSGGENTYVNHGGGNSGGWVHWEVTLPSNCVWVAFGFSSSASGNNAEGAYVDDIVLTGVRETTNLNLTPQYDDNMDAYMYRTVDLSGYSFAMLSYWYWISSESYYDYLQASYHTSSGWTYTNTQSGNSNGWVNMAVNLTSAVDMVGFRFYSDGYFSNFEGAFLDDVVLVGYKNPTGSIAVNGGNTHTSSTSATLSLTYQAFGTTVSQVRYSNDGAAWTAWEAPTATKAWTLTLGDGVKTVYYQIKDAEDLVSSAISDTITLDTTPPTGSVVINGGAASTSSTSVTLMLGYTDAGSGVSQVRYSNDGVWDTESWEPPTATKAWTLPPGDGTKTVYYQVKDNSGLLSSTYSDTITLQPPVDTTPPTGSIIINGGAATTTSTSVTLTLSATDAESGVSQIRLSNDGFSWSGWEAYATSKAWSLTSGDGSKTVYAQFKNGAGLDSVTYSDLITLQSPGDTTPPTGSIAINGGASTTSSTSVTLTLSATDPESGVAQMRFSNDGSSWSSWEAYAASKPWTLASGDGTKTVHCQFKNGAGLSSSTYTDTIFLDTTPPTGSIQINDGSADTGVTGVMLSLSYADAGSGVSQVRLSNDGTWDTEPWETPAAVRGWTLPSGDGTKTVYFQIRDNGGLISSTSSDTIILDTSTPQGSIQINSGADYTNTTTVTLNLLATDAGSGVWGMRLSNDGANWTSWEPYKTTKTWSLEGGPGEKRVHVQFIDNVDLTVWAYDNTTLDTILPVANAGQNQNAQVGQTVTFNGTGSTDNSGIASYMWIFGDGATGTGVTPTHTYATAGNYTVSLMVTDLAGNTAATTATVTIQVIIPEFPSALMLAALVTVTLAVSLAFRRKAKYGKQ